MTRSVLPLLEPAAIQQIEDYAGWSVAKVVATWKTLDPEVRVVVGKDASAPLTSLSSPTPGETTSTVERNHPETVVGTVPEGDLVGVIVTTPAPDSGTISIASAAAIGVAAFLLGLLIGWLAKKR
jgi:hypothetical protein